MLSSAATPGGVSAGGCFVGLAINLRLTPTHLHVTVTGEYTDEDAKIVLARVTAAAHAQDSRNILIDCLGVTGDLSMRQRFELAASVLQMRITSLLHGQPARYRTAVVAKPPLVHPNRYLIRLLVERNMRITVCDSVEEALAWLGTGAQAPQPSP